MRGQEHIIPLPFLVHYVLLKIRSLALPDGILPSYNGGDEAVWLRETRKYVKSLTIVHVVIDIIIMWYIEALYHARVVELKWGGFVSN